MLGLKESSTIPRFFFSFCYLAQASPKLTNLLPQSPECWHYRHESLSPAASIFPSCHHPSIYPSMPSTHLLMCASPHVFSLPSIQHCGSSPHPSPHSPPALYQLFLAPAFLTTYAGNLWVCMEDLDRLIFSMPLLISVPTPTLPHGWSVCPYYGDSSGQQAAGVG